MGSAKAGWKANACGMMPLVKCRESRYFSTWKKRRQVEDLQLPEEVRQATAGQQRTVPFGDAVLAFEDAMLGVETCEELFTPAAPCIDLALSGVEIISNGSGSHHQVESTILPPTIQPSKILTCENIQLSAPAMLLKSWRAASTTRSCTVLECIQVKDHLRELCS